MKRLDPLAIAAALVASSALAVLPAMAQNDIQPRIQQEQGTSEPSAEAAPEPRADEPAAQASPNDNAATEAAPGQLLREGAVESATEAAPGQRQQSGEVESAQEAAPGQVKRDDQAIERTPSDADEADSTAEAPAGQERTGEADTAEGADPDRARQQDQAAEEQPSDETTASIDISSEQRVEIRNVIQEVNVEPVPLDIDVRVGVAVPRTVELRPLPRRIVEIVPAYEGYMFLLLADGRILIIEPASYEIVYVLVA